MTKGDKEIRQLVSLARIGFEGDVHRLMDINAVSRAELARRYGTKPSRVSKLLNGAKNNYTLQSMAKIARALDAILEVRLADSNSEVVRVMPFHEALFMGERAQRAEEFADSDQTSNIVVLNPARRFERPVGASVAQAGEDQSPDPLLATGTGS